MFYRHNTSRSDPFTQLFTVDLDPGLRPCTVPRLVDLPKVSDKILSFEDPRAFVWQDSLWLLHTQATYTAQGRWAACIALSRFDRAKNKWDVHAPDIGHNINFANHGTSFRFEKNWTPVVAKDRLFVIYTIDPLVVMEYLPVEKKWIEIATGAGLGLCSSFLSGGTPLIPYKGNEQIGLYHTYDAKQADDRRIYRMGFYTVDVTNWKITSISAAHLQTEGPGRLWDLRVGVRERLGLRKPSAARYEVVFPCGIVDHGDEWAVSLGWNDCRSQIMLFPKADIAPSLRAIASPAAERPFAKGLHETAGSTS